MSSARVTTLQQWSSSRSPPDASPGAFSSSLTTTVFSQRSMRRLEASPRRAAPKGQQSFISRTAPHQETHLPTWRAPSCVRDTRCGCLWSESAGRHRAPLASPAAQASRARRAGGNPGTATMSHRCGPDRHDVTSWRLAAPSPALPQRGGRGRRGRRGGRGARGAAARSTRHSPPGNSLQRSHTHAAFTLLQVNDAEPYVPASRGRGRQHQSHQHHQHRMPGLLS